MRFRILLVALLLSVFGPLAWAGSGSVTFTWASASRVVVATSNSCADVVMAINGWFNSNSSTVRAYACSADPVGVGSLLTYATNSTIPVTAISATGTVEVLPAFDYVSAASIFIFFFSSVVALWFAAKNFGLILDAVRRF